MKRYNVRIAFPDMSVLGNFFIRNVNLCLSQYGVPGPRKQDIVFFAGRLVLAVLHVLPPY